MNKFIYLFSFLPFISIGQNSWIQTEQGNAFDGYAKMAHVWDTTDELGLVVINHNSEVFLNVDSETDFHKTSISITKEENTNLLIDLADAEKILISFDRDKEVYYVDFYPKSDAIILRDAISEDLKNYLDRYALLDMFKSKGEIHFRIVSKNNHHDFTFSLDEANSALNKTVRYTPGKNWSEISGLLAWVQKWENLYQWKITQNCFNYLENKFGDNTLKLIESIELSEDGKELIFHLKFGLGETKIPRNIFIKDAQDADGNFIPDPNQDLD